MYYFRVRFYGKPDCMIVVESKTTKIDKVRLNVKDKLCIEPNLQRLFYGGKLLEDGYSLHDYGIKLNDVIQLIAVPKPIETPVTEQVDNKASTSEVSKIKVYKDATSAMYKVGEFVDIRSDNGTWHEGCVYRIVENPDEPIPSEYRNPRQPSKTESSSTPTESESNQKSKKQGIKKYFEPNKKKKLEEINIENYLLFQIKFEAADDVFCKINEIRPRARVEIDTEDLKVGQKVMLNYNMEHPNEKGDWYDFEITNISHKRKTCELTGSIHFGPQTPPIEDIEVLVQDKIFKIEHVVPLAKRTDTYITMMVTPTEPRTERLLCLVCRDVKGKPCKDCGCFVCAGKEPLDEILLCDECEQGYHMGCLSPPLTAVPEDSWYCPACKRDTKQVVAPGAAKQRKKTVTTNRDWGKGMACIGKTKDCALPRNHFGPIPGVEVGTQWIFRIQLSEAGVHRPPVSGIHGRDTEGAFSIVLSGGYEDDVDLGHEFIYTGSGGRDLGGNKRTAPQSCSQTLTRENRALARNCATPIKGEGGDAGERWREGKPVRVVRSVKMRKHFPKYAPAEGYRYDGIYKVVKYYSEPGISGHLVWKFVLRRDDPAPAPWEHAGNTFPVIYPDGYEEAQKEKERQKDAKKNKKGSNKSKPLGVTTKDNIKKSNDSSELSDSSDNKETDTFDSGGTKMATRKRKSSRIENVASKRYKADSLTAKNLDGDNKKQSKSKESDKSDHNGKGDISKSNEQIDDESENSDTDWPVTPKSTDGQSVIGSVSREKSQGNNDENRTPSVGKTRKRYKDMKDQSKASLQLDSEIPSEVDRLKCDSEDALEKDSVGDSPKSEIPEQNFNGFSHGEIAAHPYFTDAFTHIREMIAESDKDTSGPTNESTERESTSNSSGLTGTNELTTQQREAVCADVDNKATWDECLDVLKSKGKMAFVCHLLTSFQCAICQDATRCPVTTPCRHTFCKACLLKTYSSNQKICPTCRSHLTSYVPETNTFLTNALRSIVPGYDAKH